MNNNLDNHRSIAAALFVAVVLAWFGEWLGFSVMVLIALIQTYREYKSQQMYFNSWEDEQKRKLKQ